MARAQTIARLRAVPVGTAEQTKSSAIAANFPTERELPLRGRFRLSSTESVTAYTGAIMSSIDRDAQQMDQSQAFATLALREKLQEDVQDRMAARGNGSSVARRRQPSGAFARSSHKSVGECCLRVASLGGDG
jgi:hypothetical protein